MMMKIKHVALALGVGIFAVGCSTMSNTSANTATYKVTFIPNFTAATHPYDGGPKHPEHFVPFAGATHTAAYSVFKVGQTPSTGLELLSEHGAGEGIKAETHEAMNAGTACSFIGGGKRSWAPKFTNMTFSFTATDKCHFVGFAGMFAPSPDWFTGVSNLNLMANGHWVQSITVPAYIYDSGGDTGKTYTAKNQNTNPKLPVTKSKAKYFVVNGKIKPVGKFVIQRVS